MWPLYLYSVHYLQRNFISFSLQKSCLHYHLYFSNLDKVCFSLSFISFSFWFVSSQNRSYDKNKILGGKKFLMKNNSLKLVEIFASTFKFVRFAIVMIHNSWFIVRLWNQTRCVWSHYTLSRQQPWLLVFAWDHLVASEMLHLAVQLWRDCFTIHFYLLHISTQYCMLC